MFQAYILVFYLLPGVTAAHGDYIIRSSILWSDGCGSETSDVIFRSSMVLLWLATVGEDAERWSYERDVSWFLSLSIGSVITNRSVPGTCSFLSDYNFIGFYNSS